MLHPGKSKALGAQRPGCYVTQLHRIFHEDVLGNLLPSSYGFFMLTQLSESITFILERFGSHSARLVRIVWTYMVRDPLPSGDGLFMSIGYDENGTGKILRRDSQNTQIICVVQINVLRYFLKGGDRIFVAFLPIKSQPFTCQYHYHYSHNARLFRVIQTELFKYTFQDFMPSEKHSP